MNHFEVSLILHKKRLCKVKAETKENLSILYTNGVIEPCSKIFEKEENVYKYT